MKKVFLLLLVLTAFLGCSALGSGSQSQGDLAVPTQEQVKTLLDEWIAAVNAGEKEKVVQMYSKSKLVFHPTLLDQKVTDEAGVQSYFDYFMGKSPKMTVIKNTPFEGPGFAINSGIYNVETPDGAVTRARFTFTYALENGKWLISTHLSAIAPPK